MGIADINVDGKMVPSIQLGTPHMATIMILDDDHGGIFQASIAFVMGFRHSFRPVES